MRYTDRDIQTELKIFSGSELGMRYTDRDIQTEETFDNITLWAEVNITRQNVSYAQAIRDITQQANNMNGSEVENSTDAMFVQFLDSPDPDSTVNTLAQSTLSSVNLDTSRQGNLMTKRKATEKHAKVITTRKKIRFFSEILPSITNMQENVDDRVDDRDVECVELEDDWRSFDDRECDWLDVVDRDCDWCDFGDRNCDWRDFCDRDCDWLEFEDRDCAVEEYAEREGDWCGLEDRDTDWLDFGSRVGDWLGVDECE
ncbi:hypothetical protein WN51_07128 [Melipona quadrifasciata]|uniref:Uncharacterized protein n=1 Tax=Melipona quadrifasciata TaxID=166423 RepID=A0A0M8ZQC6_9HYME|nr:hypothetical protein WN51_07128 [Melipona quadrifasciata]